MAAAAAPPTPSTTTTATNTSTSPASTATTVISLTDDDLREIFLLLPDILALVRAALINTSTSPASTATTATNTSTSPASTATNTSTSPASTATTVISLTDDDLREIFLLLPDILALVRAALTNTSTSPASTATNTSTSPASTATTVFSLTDDNLREIFLRLPDLRALVRAALTCRPWLRIIRSSRPFRRLFRALHPAPLLGLFLSVDSDRGPSFLPLLGSDPAAVRRGDFFLTSLPPSPTWWWSLVDCRDGYLLLWNGDPDGPSVARLNPITWALDVLPTLPDQIDDGSERDFAILGFHLLCSDESPRSFRVTCVCSDWYRVRVAAFSSATWEWVVRPWVPVGGDCSLKCKTATMLNGSVFWPYHGEARMIRIDVSTMDVSFLDLPPLVEVVGRNFGIGETGNGELCIAYVSDFFLHMWVRRSVDGTEVWAQPMVINLGEEIGRVTQLDPAMDVQLDLQIVQVRPGLVHLSSTCIHDDTLYCWLMSLSLETMELDLLLRGSFHGENAHLYHMAWPPSLVGDDE